MKINLLKLPNTVDMLKNLFKKIIFLPTSPYITKLIGDLFFYHKTKYKHNTSIDLFQMKRLLVVRLDHIGDMVMTSPFLRELRRNLPDARITLVVLPSVFNLVENCPYVNEVLSCDWVDTRDVHRFQHYWKAWRFAKRALRKRPFDLAILPRRGIDVSHAAILAYFSCSQYRVGYSDKDSDAKIEYFRINDCLLTHVLDSNIMKHEVESNLELLRFLKADIQDDKIELWISNKDKLYAENILKSKGINKDNLLIAFAPSKWDPRCVWPISRFADLALWIHKTYDAKIIILGGKDDELLGQQIKKKLGNNVMNVAGQTTLRQASALLEYCKLFVGNDSGPKHLAAAAGVPIIEINCHPLDGLPFHTESPGRFGPRGVPYRILQPKTAISPCSESCIAHEAHCILSVTIDKVKKAVAELLSCQGYLMLY
ncbi:Glycosyltransferase family 9 protein [Candidatus Magnetomoraceae bacterium gMMP-15]